jgi:hypothetical protein
MNGCTLERTYFAEYSTLSQISAKKVKKFDKKLNYLIAPLNTVF